jgi:hypothetical protein
VDEEDDVEATVQHHGKAMLAVGPPREEERRGADHITRTFKCAETTCRIRVALTVTIPWGS